MTPKASAKASASARETRIVRCGRCPRLRNHCKEIARTKRRAYLDWSYWGKPVPTFGVESPKVWVLGLAPGAHGANRTGRVFTGDSSGDWLYRALHDAGFANQAESTSREDGLQLVEAAVGCAVRCAPPDNKPNREERDTCRAAHLLPELAAYRELRVVVALGRIAFEEFLKTWGQAQRASWTQKPRFAHGAEFATEDGKVTLLTSYHPSRQNTQTGRLSREMFQTIFDRARDLLTD